jgi:hypothetical protein
MNNCGVWRENQAVEWSEAAVAGGEVETVRQRDIDYFLKYFLFKIIILKIIFNIIISKNNIK